MRAQLEVRSFQWWYAVVGVAVFAALQPAVAMAVKAFGLSEGMTRLFSGTLGFSLFALVAILVPRVFAGSVSRADFGLAKLRWWRIIWTAILVDIVLTVIVDLWSSMGSNADTKDQVVQSMGLGQSVAGDFAMIIAVVILAPICEELFFRGLIFRALRDGGARFVPLPVSIAAAALISGLCFAAVHNAPGQEAQFAILVISGILWAVLYEISGSILAPILVHAVNNAMSAQFTMVSNPDVTLSAAWLGWIVPAGPVIVIGLMMILRAMLRD